MTSDDEWNDPPSIRDADGATVPERRATRAPPLHVPLVWALLTAGVAVGYLQSNLAVMFGALVLVTIYALAWSIIMYASIHRTAAREDEYVYDAEDDDDA